MKNNDRFLKITKTREGAWYRFKVGEVFKIKGELSNDYRVINPKMHFHNCLIDKSDCVIVG